MSGDEDLKQVLQKRSAAKGWLTRAGNKLKDVSESSDTTETLLTLCCGGRDLADTHFLVPASVTNRQAPRIP